MNDRSFFITVLIVLFLMVGVGVVIGHSIWGDNTQIAPSYALDSGCTDQSGRHLPCFTDEPKPFDSFWQEATKNTYFTKDNKPVEITDVQIFYRIKECICKSEDCRLDSRGVLHCDSIYTYGNITYYPLGVENSQTCVAPAPTPTPCVGITCPPNYPIPTPCTVEIYDIKYGTIRIPCPTP